MTVSEPGGRDDDGLVGRLRRHARRIARGNATLRRGLQIAAVVAPIIAGAIQVIADGWQPGIARAVAITVQIALLAATALCSGWLLLTDDTTPELIQDAQEALGARDEAAQDLVNAGEQIEFLQEDLEWSALLYLTVAAMRGAVDTALAEPEDADARRKRLYVLLDLLVANKMSLFDIGDEQWNFAIYLFDEAKGVLVCEACRRPTKDEQDAPHRSWKSGEGHTGKAFQDRRALVCANSDDPNVRGFFAAPPGQTHHDDHRRYRSLAAIPIMLSPEHAPVGVVVATSNIEGRFQPPEEELDVNHDRIEPLRALARTLATLIAAYNVQSSE